MPVIQAQMRMRMQMQTCSISRTEVSVIRCIRFRKERSLSEQTSSSTLTQSLDILTASTIILQMTGIRKHSTTHSATNTTCL